MKKLFILACSVSVLVLLSGAAFADSIKGRIGVTGRLGFLIPSDSDVYDAPYELDTDVGFIGGGGLIYGITKNFAAELDITYTEFDADAGPYKAADFETTNISLGAQYRFVDLPLRQLVPYVGAGVDILVNDATNAEVDTTAGIHVSGGVDYFVLKQLALTAEAKAVLAPDADIKYQGAHVGDYDPSSFATTFGVRYFFN
ncbi:MAG: OmpW family protein [Geobacteraceae bacterium]|jgi:outer membrane protein|nr:OmpW family protein [Geobacteraceae bacterium]